MYAKYAYVNGATQANTLADICAILAGETTVANLSAACDQANTTITSAVAAGWTMHDASAGTNQRVLKAPHADNGSSYKYLLIDHTNTGYINFVGYESWNATAHTGTNPTANAITSSYQRKNTTGAGVFHIFSSARFAAFCCEYSTYWGDNSYGGPTIFAEMSRLLPWSTSSNGMPSFALIYPAPCLNNNSNLMAYLTRALRNDGVAVTGASAQCNISTIGAFGQNIANALYHPDGSEQKIPNGLGQELVPRFPVYVSYPAVFGPPVGDISSVSDIWLAPKTLLGNFETVTVGGNSYIALKGYVNAGTDVGIRFLFRNG